MSFDRSLGSPLFIVGDIIVVPVEETGRGLFKEIFFVVRWLSTFCKKKIVQNLNFRLDVENLFQVHEIKQLTTDPEYTNPEFSLCKWVLVYLCKNLTKLQLIAVWSYDLVKILVNWSNNQLWIWLLKRFIFSKDWNFKNHKLPTLQKIQSLSKARAWTIMKIHESYSLNLIFCSKHDLECAQTQIFLKYSVLKVLLYLSWFWTPQVKLKS